jgi:hypothetical protein
VDIAVLDGNGDGFADVAVAARDGRIFLFLGYLDGTFDPALPLFAAPGIEGIRAADLDGDGRAEIIATVDRLGTVVVAPAAR